MAAHININSSSIKRCIIVLLDGLGDRAHPELENRTPLQAASTPHLDTLARLGANGILHAGRLGMALPSENAHFTLFGYRQDEFPGRGYLEALGAGEAVSPDDVVFLAHFVSVRKENDILVLEKDRPEVTAEEALALSRAVGSYAEGGFACSYRQTRALDGVLVMSGNVTPHVTDSDPLPEGGPLIDISPLRRALDDPKTTATAQALKSYLIWCYDALENHPVNRARRLRGALPVNALVTQRPGQWRQVEPFSSRWGLAGVSIASGLVYWGLASFLGMNVCKVKDTVDPGADLAERLRLAFAPDMDADFIHVHTKAPDVAAHTKSPRNKLAAIETLDRGLAPLLDHLEDQENLIIVTADHSTPSSGPLVHSGEPVPILMAGPGVRRDNVFRFDEIHCPAGALGLVRGDEFMYLVLNNMDRAKLQGLMDTPEDQPYWPGARQPFRLRRG